MTLIVLLNLIATWYMVGLIWMVQIVHYAMFDRVGRDVFAAYSVDHSRLITPIVGFPMLIELSTAVWLLFQSPVGLSRSWWVAGVVLVGLIWLSTAFLQVPAHQVLSGGFDDAAYRRLVDSNWVRTTLWTVRGVMMAYVTYRLMG